VFYYSTNHTASRATLRDAVVRGLAEDRGLYMPEVIKQLPASFWSEIANLTFQEVAYRVADAFFGEDVPADDLRRIVYDTLSFDTPIVHVEDNIYALELFHGPTLAFKDVGARFMARLLQWTLSPLSRKGESLASLDSCAQPLPSITGGVGGGSVNVLVATSGDTGSAVANGFLGVEGIHVYVLYPKGKVSPIQECQFTTLGQNITAIEVDGVFDDCQRLVKSAFMDADLNAHMRLTSANSINVARFLPQAFYYFWAYAQIVNRKLSNRKLVFCVPSGNFGNICSALFGHVMGLPVHRFIAANNANDVFYNYLQSGIYTPQPSKQTIANAMDVGDPSNFARILDLYSRPDVQSVLKSRDIAQPLPSLAEGGEAGSFISGATYSDDQIAETMRDCYARTGYVLDPHGACGYRALKEQLHDDETGIFLETAHPAKFKDTVDRILGIDLPIPEKLQAFMRGQKQSIPLSSDFADFKAYLLAQ
jgi:threonine synthase